MLSALKLQKITDLVESILLKRIGVKRALPLQLDLTNACNLACKHCYHDHHKNTGNLRTEDYVEVLRQYAKMVRNIGYSGDILLCGGEPLLSEHFSPIVKEIAENYPDFKLGILTNGTLIHHVNDNVHRYLAKIKQVDFQVSLDGPDAKTHDLVRGQGSFSRAKRGIGHLQKLGYPVHILSVLSTRTSNKIEDFFALSKELSVRSMGFTRFIPLGIGRDIGSSIANENTILGDALKSAFQNILIFSSKYRVKTNLNMPLMHLIVPGLGRSGRFFEGLVVDYQGYILASSRLRVRLGHFVKDGLENVFVKHELFKALREPSKLGCGACKYFKVCGGDRNVAYAVTGDYLSKDPGCWLKNEY